MCAHATHKNDDDVVYENTMRQCAERSLSHCGRVSTNDKRKRQRAHWKYVCVCVFLFLSITFDRAMSRVTLTVLTCIAGKARRGIV